MHKTNIITILLYNNITNASVCQYGYEDFIHSDKLFLTDKCKCIKSTYFTSRLLHYFVVISAMKPERMKKMARHGENIRKRQDGRWEARFIESYIRGKAKYRYVYGKTYTEAKAKREEFMVKSVSKTLPPAKKLTTLDWLSYEWLNSIKKQVKESTYTRYFRNINKYISPELGSMLIVRIDANIINDWESNLLQRLSAKTVTDILSVLKQILKYSEKIGYSIPDINLISAPKRIAPEINIYSETSRTDIERILWSSKNELCAGVLMTLYTGIRIGELCGLRWSDFDFRDRAVRISRTVERISDLDPMSSSKTKVIICEPKTENSQRTIPLPQFLSDYLLTKKKEGSCYVTTGTDKPSEPHTIYVRYTRFLKNSGIEKYTFHALRHTFATQCADAGFDAKSLSEILGHSNVSTTLRCYVHPSLETKRKQMELLSPEKIRGQNFSQEVVKTLAI